MANTKKVYIKGDMPFDCGRGEYATTYAKLLEILGIFNMPVFGLRITYTSRTRSEKNRHNGTTSFYEFELQGVEALRHELLQDFCRYVKHIGGKMYYIHVYDIDGQETQDTHFAKFLSTWEPQKIVTWAPYGDMIGIRCKNHHQTRGMTKNIGFIGVNSIILEQRTCKCAMSYLEPVPQEEESIVVP